MNTVECLENMLRLIGKGWTQNTLARDNEGYGVYHSAKSAVSWCLTGALWATNTSDVPLTTSVQNYLKLSADIDLSYGSLVDWNDKPKRTQEEVIAVVKKAIELTKADQT